VSGDNVLPFRRPAPKVGAPVPTAPGRIRSKGFAIVLEASPGAVCLIVGENELWLEPAQARELASDLVELAADAESGAGGA